MRFPWKKPKPKPVSEALLKAARAGLIQDVRTCLDRGEDVNCRDGSGLTPLYLAAAGGHFEVVRLLLSHGADVHAKSDNGIAVLDVATNAYPFTEGHVDIVEMLLEAGADADYRRDGRDHPIQRAAYASERMFLALFHKVKHPLPARVVQLCVSGLATKGSAKGLKAMFDQYPDIPQEDLQFALRNVFKPGYEEAIRLLVDQGANIDAKPPYSRTTIQELAREGKVEDVRRMLEFGANPHLADELDGETTLHQAAYAGEPALIRLLIDKGVSLEPLDNLGRTPLMTAAKNIRLSAVRLLIELGADKHRTDKLGFDCLSLAKASLASLYISDTYLSYIGTLTWENYEELAEILKA